MNKINQLFINMYYVISSNLLTLIVSVVSTLFLPRVLGIEGYGYYQLYLLYIPYVSFLHLGWPDGIYLKFGGEDYSKLDKKYFKEQFYSLLIFQSILALVFFVILYFNQSNILSENLIFIAVILNIILLNMRTFLLFILQMTNKMKEYSKIVIIDRMIFVLLILCLLLLNKSEFIYYVVADIISKIISLIFTTIECKDFLYENNYKVRINLREALNNIKIGINIMLAYISGLFIIGVIRFGIQNHWGVETFGEISLSLSISNILMVFISAISVAIFPLLRRTSELNYRQTYLQIKTLLMTIILGAMIFYFPMIFLLYKWLPAYNESLKYMAIIFPIVIFEGKVNLLTNTYLKVLRKERIIFKVNLVSAILSMVVGVISIYLLNDLFLSVLSIVVLLAFRSAYAEIALAKYLDINPYKDMIIEFIFSFVFIFVSMNYSRIIGMTFYSLLFLLYLFYQRKQIYSTVTLIKNQLLKNV